MVVRRGGRGRGDGAGQRDAEFAEAGFGTMADAHDFRR